jgi:DNA polymerase I-like protein with 3'-5' exonuclease and polymerase domains
MVAEDHFLIDSTILLKTCETSFLGASLFPGIDGQDHTCTFGFVRDVFRIRKKYGICKASIIFGKESIAVTSEFVLSDIIALLEEIKANVVRHDNVLVGEICRQLSPYASWILTENRAMQQLVTDDLGVILINDGDLPESITMKEMMLLGIQPEQVPDLLALSDGKKAPLKIQKTIRLLQIYKSLEEIIVDCATGTSADWKRKLFQQKESLLNKEKEYRFRSDIQIAISAPHHNSFIENSAESVAALSSRGFRSLLRLLPAPTAPTVRLETSEERKTDYRAMRSRRDLQYLQECLLKVQLCAIDTETSSKDPRNAILFGLSLSIKEKQAFFVPMLKSDLDDISPDEVKKWLNQALHNNLKFIGHNLKYDFAVLWKNGIIVQALHFDTMLAAYECYGDWDLWNLAAVAKKLLGVTIKRYKEIVGKGETFLDRPFSELVEHACCDADMTLRLYRVLNRELRKRQLERKFFDETMRLENILLENEYTGLRIDVDRMSAVADSLKIKMNSLRSSIFSCAGCEFDVDSPKSTTDVLRKLGIWQKTTQSVGDVQLEQLACSHDLPFLITRYRRIRNRYKEVDALCSAEKGGRIFSSLSQIKFGHGCLWSSSPALEEAVIAQAIQDKQLLGIISCPETALQNLLDICEDSVLRSDLKEYKRGDNFIPGELDTQGVSHCEILLYIAIGLPDATICRKLLIPKDHAARIRTAITSRYEQLFERLGQFTRVSLENGYAEHEGRRKYLAGLRSSDLEKRSKAVRSAIRWLIRY